MSQEKFDVFNHLKPDDNLKNSIIQKVSQPKRHEPKNRLILVIASSAIVILVAALIFSKLIQPPKPQQIVKPEPTEPVKPSETENPIPPEKDGEYLVWNLTKNFSINTALLQNYSDANGNINSDMKVPFGGNGMGDDGSFFSNLDFEGLENTAHETVDYFAKPVLKHDEILRFKKIIEEFTGESFVFNEKGNTEVEFLADDTPTYVNFESKSADLDINRDGSGHLNLELENTINSVEDAENWLATSWFSEMYDLEAFENTARSEDSWSYTVTYIPSKIYFDEFKERLHVSFRFDESLEICSVSIDFPTFAQDLMNRKGFNEHEIYEKAKQQYREQTAQYLIDINYDAPILGYEYGYADTFTQDVVIPIYRVYVKNENGVADQVIIGADEMSHQLIVDRTYTPGFN